MVIQHLKQIGKMKKLNKWVPHELTKNQKKITILKCCLLQFYTTIMNHFLIGLWHMMKSGFYTTTSEDKLSGWTEKKLSSTSQSQVKVAQSCPTLCDPMDYTVHEILQARTLQWVAIPFSRGSSQLRDWTQVSCTAGRFFTTEPQGKPTHGIGNSTK